MRILVVSSTFPQFQGDPRGVFVQRYWERAAQGGDTVRVLAPRTAWCRGELGGACEVARFAYAPRRHSTLSGRFGILENLREQPRRALLLLPFQLALARALARELRRFRPDRLAAHMLLPCGWASARAATRAGVPFTLYGHGTDVDLLLALPAPLRRRFSRWARGAERIFLPSREKLRRFERAFPGLAPLSVERMEQCVAPGARRAQVPRGRTVLSLGRLIRQKGVDVLLHAAARLEPPVRLEVAGDGPERARLEALAASLGVDARFHGYVDEAQRELLFAAARVLCVPSRELRGGLSEGSPLVVVEALQRGLPVVASRVGGIPELGAAGDPLTLVPPSDIASLASALDAALVTVTRERVRA